MVNDPRVTAELARLGGVYRDPQRVDRDASSLLKSSVGATLVPISATRVENNGYSSTVLVLQGTIAIFFRGNTYQVLVDIYLPGGYVSLLLLACGNGSLFDEKSLEIQITHAKQHRLFFFSMLLHPHT